MANFRFKMQLKFKWESDLVTGLTLHVTFSQVFPLETHWAFTIFIYLKVNLRDTKFKNVQDKSYDWRNCTLHICQSKKCQNGKNTKWSHFLLKNIKKVHVCDQAEKWTNNENNWENTFGYPFKFPVICWSMQIILKQ